jgi:hypothetical protein
MQVDNNGNSQIAFNAIPTDVNHLEKMPPEILARIFSLLPGLDLASCSSVSHLCNQVTHGDVLLKSKYSQDVVEDFTPLVEEGYLSWKEVPRYARFSSFLARVLQEHYCTDKFIGQENPQFYTQFSDSDAEWPTICMPTPFVKYGNMRFSICNLTDIKLQKKGEIQSTILRGEENKTIVFLAVERNHLFALRQDGMIIEWDHREGKITDKIETAYTRRHPSLGGEVRRGKFYSNGCFLVQNGFIVLKYGAGSTHVLEIIPCSNKERSQIIEDVDINSTCNLLIDKGKLFILNRMGICVYNISKVKKEYLFKLDINSVRYIRDIVIDKNIIYANDDLNNVHVIDASSGKEIKTCLFPQLVLKIEVIGNLLFGTAWGTIMVLDINKGEIFRKISGIFDGEGKEIREQVLRMLVETVKTKGGVLQLPELPKEDNRGFGSCMIA